MPTSAYSSPPAAVSGDLAARAASLINPASGLANDYLNVFNEIVMMIDLVPNMRDLAENIETWSPITYRAYFARSTLAGRQDALTAYARLDPAFRRSFERCARDLSRAARAVCASVLDLTQQSGDGASDALAMLCSTEVVGLRARLEAITDMVNSGPSRAAA